MTNPFLTLALSAFLFYSCKTASKAYQKGEYTEAIELGVKKLQRNTHDRISKDMVQKAYSYEIKEHEDNVQTIRNSNSDLMYERIYQEYSHLQHLYYTIHQTPAVAELIPPKDYSAELASYGQKAALLHEDKGNQWMNEANKLAYREAFKEFSIALRFLPDNYDLKRKRDDAYDAAVTKVIIAQMNNFGDNQISTPGRLQNFQREVLGILVNNMNNGFVQFYSDWDAKNKNLRADQILELNLNHIVLGQPYDEKNTREISKQVVMKEIVYKPDSIVKQYGTVYAKIVNIKRTLVSQADLIITLRDTKGGIIWNDHFTGQNKWQTEFASFTGDERALEEGDKNLCKKDYNAPSNDKIMDDLFHKVQDDVGTRLRNYYTKLL